MAMLEIKNLSKTYDNGFSALKSANLTVKEGEILALLGPNGAGKTSLISATCGLTNITSGTITVGGFDVVKQPLQARRQISLVPKKSCLSRLKK